MQEAFLSKGYLSPSAAFLFQLFCQAVVQNCDRTAASCCFWQDPSEHKLAGQHM